MTKTGNIDSKNIVYSVKQNTPNFHQTFHRVVNSFLKQTTRKETYNKMCSINFSAVISFNKQKLKLVMSVISTFNLHNKDFENTRLDCKNTLCKSPRHLSSV